MAVSENIAKSILRKQKKIDSWFVSRYGMNLYRGCLHNCIYCDGRAEKYNVEGEFGRDISVKTNAPDLLRRELDPSRKRKPFEPGFFLIGGGVTDGYQPVEIKYRSTRTALQLLGQFNHPIHILTKSDPVADDLDIIRQINRQCRAVVSMSFSTADAKISAVLEPGVPAPARRLEVLNMFKNEGVPCGMYLLPVVPYLTDSEEMMESTIAAAKKAGVDFIIFGGLTLKEGRQKEYFLRQIKKIDTGLAVKIAALYPGSEWGEAKKSYYDQIHRRFFKLAVKHNMPLRMPPGVYQNILDRKNSVIIALEHADYIRKMQGAPSGLGYAAYQVSRFNSGIEFDKKSIYSIKGLDGTGQKIISEILNDGHSGTLSDLIYYN